MNKILSAVLKDVDPDIRKLMMQRDGDYKNWELVASPELTAVMWQLVRNSGKASKK